MELFRHFFGRRRSRPKPAWGGQNLQSLLEGYRATALIYVAAKLKLADLLAEGPRSSQELAKLLQVHSSALHRVLRGLVALELCSETESGRFLLTPLGRQLESGGPEYNQAILIGEEHAPAWNDLLHSVRTGETAFHHVFGESPWRHRQKNAELNQCFNAWLDQGAGFAGHAILNAYDFSRHQTVADLGGGQGALLAAVLQKHRALRGILFDQPHVIPAARRALESAGVGSRCQIMEGDFFEAIPPGADVLVLKSILHDWDDEKCLLILKNCRAVLKPGQPLLVVERLLPARAADHPATILGDLHMLAVTGGEERTSAEYKALLAAAGFELNRIIPLATGHSLLETLRA